MGLVVWIGCNKAAPPPVSPTPAAPAALETDQGSTDDCYAACTRARMAESVAWEVVEAQCKQSCEVESDPLLAPVTLPENEQTPTQGMP